MKDLERREHAAFVSESAMRAADELNEDLARRAAIYRCDKCPNTKRVYSCELELPNGVRMSLDYSRCESPDSVCTAEVASHLLSESPSVANRIIEWLAEQPELKLLGVTWWTCGEERHVLTYPTPAEAKVVKAAGAVPVGDFRTISK